MKLAIQEIVDSMEITEVNAAILNIYKQMNACIQQKGDILSTLFDNLTSFAFSVFYFGYAFFCKNGLKIKMLIKLTFLINFNEILICSHSTLNL